MERVGRGTQAAGESFPGRSQEEAVRRGRVLEDASVPVLSSVECIEEIRE